MRMLQVVQPQQVLPVVIPIRRANNGMDVLTIRQIGIGEMPQRGRALMIEFDQDHRRVDPIVENAARVGGAHPREPRAVEVGFHLVHSDPCVPLVHVGHVKGHEVEKLRALGRVQFGSAHTRVVENNVVLPRFGESVVPAFRATQDRFLPLGLIKSVHERQAAALLGGPSEAAPGARLPAAEMPPRRAKTARGRGD